MEQKEEEKSQRTQQYMNQNLVVLTKKNGIFENGDCKMTIAKINEVTISLNQEILLKFERIVIFLNQDFQCPSCEMKYPIASSLQRHFKVKHDLIEPHNTEGNAKSKEKEDNDAG